MERLLLTSGEKCPFGCKYCFARLSQYERPMALEALEANPELAANVNILYPACDTDLFASKNSHDILRRIAAFGKSVSISTKARIGPETVRVLQLLSQRLLTNGCVLKVGVSFSTKRAIAEIEPRTAGYECRLNNLALLSQAGISCCAVLKPLIAEIPATEYIEVVANVAPYVNHILMGPEYLDTLYRTACENRSIRVSYRKVNWLRNEPLWPASYPEEHRTQILAFCEMSRIHHFDSDLDLMEHLILRVGETRERKQPTGQLVAGHQNKSSWTKSN
jgi:DNA repair photolyase